MNFLSLAAIFFAVLLTLVVKSCFKIYFQSSVVICVIAQLSVFWQLNAGLPTKMPTYCLGEALPANCAMGVHWLFSFEIILLSTAGGGVMAAPGMQTTHRT